MQILYQKWVVLVLQEPAERPVYQEHRVLLEPAVLAVIDILQLFLVT
jgi:hypothetical protein